MKSSKTRVLSRIRASSGTVPLRLDMTRDGERDQGRLSGHVDRVLINASTITMRNKEMQADRQSCNSCATKSASKWYSLPYPSLRYT